MKLFITILFMMLFSMAGYSGVVLKVDDNYLSGYVKALLNERYDISPSDVVVRNNIVYLDEEIASKANYEEILLALDQVYGIESVQVYQSEKVRSMSTTTFFPSNSIFSPLIADVRWPRISAALYSHKGNDYSLENSMDLSLGGKLPIWRKNMGVDEHLEIALQAGVFALFDKDTHSDDLVNADYTFGFPVSYRYKDFSVYVRYAHTSTHLGDEYILHSPVPIDRVNVSYEKIDSILSYDINKNLRIYGGGGYAIRDEGGHFQVWSYAAGLEVVPPFGPRNKEWNLLWATHISGMEKNDFTPTLSTRFGIAFLNRALVSIDLYTGYSPHGQFYKDRETSVGVGLHIF